MDAIRDSSQLYELGVLAWTEGDLLRAKSWFFEALRAAGGAPPDPRVWLRLGMVCHAEHDTHRARDWYGKARDASGTASGTGQVRESATFGLARLAHEAGDAAAAREHYLEVLREGQGEGREASGCCFWLGRLAESDGDNRRARLWYLESIERASVLGDVSTRARSWHQIGRVFQAEGDTSQATRCYLESLRLKEQGGNELGCAITEHQLGVVERERGNVEGSARWLIRALCRLARLGSRRYVDTALENLAVTLGGAETATLERIVEIWRSAALPDHWFPVDLSTAVASVDPEAVVPSAPAYSEVRERGEN